MKKCGILVVIVAVVLCAHVAMAATCAAGKYLLDGVCQDCNTKNEPYYCPGDDMRYSCPKSDADYNKLAEQMGGHRLVGAVNARMWSAGPWLSVGYCKDDIYFEDAAGNAYLAECSWNGDNYYLPCVGSKGQPESFMYYKAVTGYYLTDFWHSSGYDWYRGVAACTNKPANSYYTGAGTPDGNDCPWECNSGYGRHNNECFQLCAAGFVSLKSNGVSVNAYAEKLTTPSINISANGKTCYVSLSSSGSPSGAIYINYNGTTYHTTD